MNAQVQLPRHFVAALAYRTQKALRGAPRLTMAARSLAPPECAVEGEQIPSYLNGLNAARRASGPTPLDSAITSPIAVSG